MGNPYRHPISTPVPELQGIASIAAPPMTDDLVGRQDDAADEEEWGCEYCRNDGRLNDNNCCPKCDAQYEEDPHAD